MKLREGGAKVVVCCASTAQGCGFMHRGSVFGLERWAVLCYAALHCIALMHCTALLCTMLDCTVDLLRFDCTHCIRPPVP